MLQEVRQDLSDVVQVCEGKKKQTNYLRTLISDLVKGKILLFHSDMFMSGIFIQGNHCTLKIPHCLSLTNYTLRE